MTVQELVDNHIASRRDPNRVRSGKYSPSMLGRCYRAQYWNRKNEPQTNPPDKRSLRVFEAGHLFHDLVQNLLKPEQVEVKVETEHFCGYADFVTEEYVGDIKSQHSKGFWYMKKDSYDVNEKKKNNILQVMFYAKHLGKKWGRLIFISKDDLCIEEYGFPLEQWTEEVAKEEGILIDIWQKQEVPDAIPRAYEGKECSYCSWKDKCKEFGGSVWTKNGGN